MRVRLLRALYFGGVRKEAGAVLDLPDHEAREDLHRGVVERVEPAPAVAPGPMTTESAPQIVAGKKRKPAHEE